MNDIAIIYDKRHIQKVNEFQTKFFEVYEMRYFEKVN